MINLFEIKEKIDNREIYKNYKAFFKRYRELGLDMSYSDDDCELIESVMQYYASLVIPEVSISEVPMSKRDLDDFANMKIGALFNGPSYFIFKDLVENKEINPENLSDTCDIIHKKIGLTYYEDVIDLEALLYEALHILIYQGDKKIAYNEILSQAFKLIVADILEEIYHQDYYKEALFYQLDSFNFNVYVNLLYPSLTPIFIPYSLGTLLANEVYLDYKNNKDRFIKNVNEIIMGKISVKEYLESIGVPIHPSSSEQIKKNHQLKLFNNC